MDKKPDSAIAENIRRLLMFKALKDIKSNIELDNQHKRNSQRLAIVVIAAVLVLLCIFIISGLLQANKQDTKIIGYQTPALARYISGEAVA